MKVEDIKKIAVIGAGIMGHGIAQICAQSGYDVTLTTRRETTLQAAMEKIKSSLLMLAENGVIIRDEVEASLMRIKATMDMVEAISDADFVIEALREDMDVKKQMFQFFDETCPLHTILSTNTSSLSITEVAAATKRPEKVVGMHWWNPPSFVPLVEVLRGVKTSDETIDVTRNLVLKLKKVPAVCKESPGYLGVRLQAALVIEAMKILAEGLASAEDIDAAVKNSFGFRIPVIGPLETVDLGGLDTFLWAYDYLFKLTRDEKYQTPELLKRKVDEGKLGVKTGEGFYKYTEESIKALVNRRDDWLLKRLKEISSK